MPGDPHRVRLPSRGLSGPHAVAPGTDGLGKVWEKVMLVSLGLEEPFFFFCHRKFIQLLMPSD